MKFLHNDLSPWLALMLRRRQRFLVGALLVWVTLMAGLALLGQQLTILHLVGLLLVVAVGSNYALFFDQASQSDANGSVSPRTLASMLFAASGHTPEAITAAEQIIAKAREAAAQDHARMLVELKREVGRLVVQTTATVTGMSATSNS